MNDRRDRTFVLLIFAFISAIACYLMTAALYAPVNPDAGYLLPTAERLALGDLPYRDLALSHTTLLLYLFALIAFVSGGTAPYEAYLIFQLLVVLADGALLYFLLRRGSLERESALLFALYAVAAILLCEGIYLEMEPFAVLFLLLGTYFLSGEWSRTRLFYSGLMFGVAFTFKQYALFALGAVFLSILFGPKEAVAARIKSLLSLAVGFIVLPLFYYGLMFSLASIYRTNLGRDLIGSWYVWHPERFLLFLERLLNYQPHILLMLFLPFYKGGFKSGRYTLFLCAAFLLSLLPGLVRQYPHYLILTIPFAVLLLTRVNNSSTYLNFGPVKLFIQIISLVTISRCLYESATLYKFRPRSDQYAMAAAVNHVIPRESTALVITSPAWNYLCKLRPTLPTTTGYNFLEVVPAEIVEEVINKAPYVILFPGEEGYLNLVLKALDTDLEALRKRLGVNRQYLSARPVEIWKLASRPD